MDSLQNFSFSNTPQQVKASEKQVQNSAGGFTFELDDKTRLRRFLILGVEGGTFYANARHLAFDNVQILQRMAVNDPVNLVDTIVDVSVSGAAPKQQPALFALAFAASVPQSSQAALAALPRVARTGSALLQFVSYVEKFRGWGRGLRRAVGSWYSTKRADDLAYQVVKYRNRGGWSHRDLLRLAHPSTSDESLRATFDWIVRGSSSTSFSDSTGDTSSENIPTIIEGFAKASHATTSSEWAALVRGYGLSWEMLPDAALNEPDVWAALLDTDVPQTALIRQLPRLTRLGLLPGLGGRTSDVVSQITDAERLRKARIHPVSVLSAQRTYAKGRSFQGTTEWEPTARISDALDEAFYLSFGAVKPANKRTLLSLDVSASMHWPLGGTPLTARDASAALSLVTLATESESMVLGFTTNSLTKGFLRDVVTPLDISARQRLDDVLDYIDGLPFGGTDCSLPMLYAMENSLEVDTFVIYTDNETWAGKMHPHQALQRYRKESGIDAKLVVAGMTATKFSIANPDDAGMLDVVGFDAAVPNLISEFSRGF